MIKKVYIGDDVYASNDGWHVILETERENGLNKVYLSREVLHELLDYSRKIGFRFDPRQDEPEPPQKRSGWSQMLELYEERKSKR